MTALLALGSALLGLAVGSFLNVVVHRVPENLSVVSPRSRCPSCRTELRPRDNIPVLSWVLLRGRCRTCAAPISVRYPLIELGTAVLFAVVALRLGPDPALPAFLVCSASLVAVSAIDLERFIIPKKIVYATVAVAAPLFVLAAALDGDWPSLREAAVGALIAWIVLRIIHLVSPRGMGYGDVRLALVVGMMLGWLTLPHVALGLFLAFLLASVIGVALIATKLRTRKQPVPFGPFLAAGALLAVLAGAPVLEWYLGW